MHNWLRIDDDSVYVRETIPGIWRNEQPANGALIDINNRSTCNSSQLAYAIRDEFCHYFNSEGAVPWQFDQY